MKYLFDFMNWISYCYDSNYEDVTNPKPLTLQDAEALNDPIFAPSIAAAAPIVQGQAEVTYAGFLSEVGDTVTLIAMSDMNGYDGLYFVQ